MQTRSKKFGGVKRPVNDFIIVTHPKETDAYRNAGYALSAVVDTPNRASKTLDLAYDRVAISGMDIYESNHCGERDLFGLRLSAFQRYEVYAPNLLSLTGDDQYLFPVPTSTGTYKHQLQFYMAFYGNLLIKVPAACFRISSLDKTNLG
jgi:hypothetical protein